MSFDAGSTTYPQRVIELERDSKVMMGPKSLEYLVVERIEPRPTRAR